MKIMVTGGAGFIGSRIVASLERDSHEVISIDKKTGHDLVKDMPHLLTEQKPEAIVHLASTCSTPLSVKEPLATFRDTVITTVTIMEVARRLSVPVLMTSSVKARDGRTPYGASKRMAELWSTEIHDAYSVPLIITRPGTIYGPGQEGSEESGWVAWFLKAKAEGIKVALHGGGNQVRDLLHVDDYVRLIRHQLENIEKFDGQVLDVGGGPENVVTVKEVADYLGLDYEIDAPRYGDTEEYIGLNDVDGWAPTIYWKESETFAL